MKRIITAMLTLALITGLSAEKASAIDVPHPTGEATGPPREWHRGIPIAGVDRLIPLAGRGRTSYPNRISGTSGPGGTTFLTGGNSGSGRTSSLGGVPPQPEFLTGGSASLEHGPGMHDSLEHGLHDNGAFLPWHRGYIHR